jgi:hypothetical protein
MTPPPENRLGVTTYLLLIDGLDVDEGRTQRGQVRGRKKIADKLGNFHRYILHLREDPRMQTLYHRRICGVNIQYISEILRESRGHGKMVRQVARRARLELE